MSMARRSSSKADCRSNPNSTKTPFHRLMIAQDTGSAILGPARADIYFGAGPEAGRVSGRLRHNMRFVMLVPKSLDPVASGRTMPLPEARPSAKIARRFPPTNQKPDDRKTAPQTAAPSTATPTGEPARGAPAAAAKPASSEAIPLPVAQPEVRSGRHHAQRHRRHHRHGRHRYPR